MNADRITQVSPLLSSQKTADDLSVVTVKLANEQIEAKVVSALALIQAIPQANSRIGSNIDVRV